MPCRGIRDKVEQIKWRADIVTCYKNCARRRNIGIVKTSLPNAAYDEQRDSVCRPYPCACICDVHSILFMGLLREDEKRDTDESSQSATQAIKRETGNDTAARNCHRSA